VIVTPFVAVIFNRNDAYSEPLVVFPVPGGLIANRALRELMFANAALIPDELGKFNAPE
jgi:hypothetical protein